jgi:Tol biopolymer transport system component
MSLVAGTKLGPYEILSPLGAGGMGEVYRARDTKLGREVALKVLPEAFAQDAERMARFQREAQVLASLNHPNIAAIYGLEESGGVRALVMELVEGPTLAELLETRSSKFEIRKPASIPVTSFDFRSSSFDPLPIAQQIAEALEYAHERGIIHRDLKPANIKITHDGAVKVLDFGLAKALDTGDPASNISNSPTISIAATQAGVILGTAAYMSPEQAKGKSVDRRADIWAFGCVFFEMLTGTKAFEGETTSDVLAAVIRAEPDWNAVPPSTPASIRKLVQRCLQKDPKQRLQAVGEARIAIEETLSGDAVRPGLAPAMASDATRPPQGAALRRRALPWTLAVVASAAFLITLGILWRATRLSPPGPIELSLSPPAAQPLFRADGPAVLLSPDGSRIAYVAEPSAGKTQIYVRDLDKPEATPLESAIGSSPFFSPDGQWIGFFAPDGGLKKVSVFGGAPVALCNADARRGGAWGEDGTIVFPPTVTSPLYRISAAGGAPVALTQLDAARKEITHRWPQILPGGKDVLFTASADNNNFERAFVGVASLVTGQTKVLIENAYFGRYLPSGYLAYVSGGTLFAVPFDVKELKVSGTAMPILPNIQGDLSNGGVQFSFSQTGTAAYMTGQAVSNQVTVVLRDRKGEASPLIQQPGDYFAPRFSPDGKQLALQVGTGNVWVYDLAQGTMTPLTFSPADCTNPTWTPDGKRIACSRRSAAGVGLGISWLPSDGTGSMEPLTKGSTVIQVPSSFSPDGRTLAFFQFSAKTGACCEIWTLPINPNGQPGQPQPFLGQDSGNAFRLPELSPDGHWMAYPSSESGTLQVYVVPFPGPGGKRQISVSRGGYPRWSRADHELFFIGGNGPASALVAVPYTVQGNSFQPGKAAPLFEGGFERRDPYPIYDVAPDGKHFAVLQVAGGKQTTLAPPTVVVNWFARVQQLVSAGQK